MTNYEAAQLVLKAYKVYEIMEGKKCPSLLELAAWNVKAKLSNSKKFVDACIMMGKYAVERNKNTITP